MATNEAIQQTLLVESGNSWKGMATRIEMVRRSRKGTPLDLRLLLIDLDVLLDYVTKEQKRIDNIIEDLTTEND